MANAKDFHDVECWGTYKKVCNYVGEWDFSKDTGAAGTYSLGAFAKKALVLNAQIYVETLCESAGAATVAVGASTADPDGFMTATSGAVANLTAGAVISETTAVNLLVAEAETLDLIIATADLTAGKIKVAIQYMNVE